MARAAGALRPHARRPARLPRAVPRRRGRRLAGDRRLRRRSLERRRSRGSGRDDPAPAKGRRPVLPARERGGDGSALRRFPARSGCPPQARACRRDRRSTRAGTRSCRHGSTARWAEAAASCSPSARSSRSTPCCRWGSRRLAEQWGLDVALWPLLAAPLALLVLVPRSDVAGRDRV